MTIGKTIALTLQTFVSKVSSLPLNTLSSFVIAFLPRASIFFFNFVATVTVQSDFGAPQNKICNCFHFPSFYLAFLAAQLVKNQPAMWEIWIWPLGLEDPPEKGMGTHSSILVWRIPWNVESMGSQRNGHEWSTFTICHGDGTGCHELSFLSGKF